MEVKLVAVCLELCFPTGDLIAPVSRQKRINSMLFLVLWFYEFRIVVEFMPYCSFFYFFSCINSYNIFYVKLVCSFTCLRVCLVRF